jgi:hypothetical protein
MNLLQFDEDNSERACTPTDFLNVTNYFDNTVFNTAVGAENTVCLPVCLRQGSFTA